MNITDLNRDGGIGCNSMLVELGPFRLLIDAGMHPKKAGLESMPEFSLVEDNSLDLVLLTHCHLDHLGSMPVLIRRQRQAQLLTSIPSRDLAGRMLRNSINVMKRQREELGKPELPLYTKQDVKRVEQRILPMAYDRTRTFHQNGSELKVTFYQAGHVAGASGLGLEYKGRKIFFTGDVLFSKQKTLAGARFPKGEMDTLVMETTRGSTVRANGTTRQDEVDRLFRTIEHFLSHGGSVLVPVFAFGRMQEILSLANDARKEGRLRKCPIFCSGLGMDLANYFDTISRKTGLLNFRRQVLKDLQVQRLPNSMKPGVNPKERGLYIVSSGMLVEHTPSYTVAASLLHHHQNGICFVGYNDPDTPGGKLLATEPGDPFLFDAIDYSCHVQAHIEKFDMSGHAERGELVEFAQSANPRAIVLNHGDPESRAWFFNELTSFSENRKILDPQPLERYLV